MTGGERFMRKLTGSDVRQWAQRIADARTRLVNSDGSDKGEIANDLLAIWNDVDLVGIDMVIEETRGT